MNERACVKDIEDLSPTDTTTQSNDNNSIAQNHNKNNNEHDYMMLHENACKNKKDFYKDPETSYYVFTKYAHLKRGKCCGSGCRHCPYNHENVSMDEKIDKTYQPAFLYEGDEKGKCIDRSNNNDLSGDIFFYSIPDLTAANYAKVKILFFSGGKDSYLALRYLVKQRLSLQQNNNANGDNNDFHLILLTTFDATSRIIAHQDIHIQIILKQAQHLSLPLLGILLYQSS